MKHKLCSLRKKRLKGTVFKLFKKKLKVKLLFYNIRL